MPYKIWTVEEDNIIREYYPTMGIDCWKLIEGRMPHQVQRRASQLGVKSLRYRNKQIIPIKASNHD